jgi:TPR repeat protein
MKEEYDLSKMKSRKNPYAKHLKKQVTMRLGVDVIEYFKLHFLALLIIFVFLTGCTECDYCIGNRLYLKGEFTQAAKHFKKAAIQENAKAQFNLAFMYTEGKGVAKNNKKAAYWYLKASEQGDIKATYNLGVLYAKGRGVEKDVNKAKKYF